MVKKFLTLSELLRLGDVPQSRARRLIRRGGLKPDAMVPPRSKLYLTSRVPQLLSELKA
jgi:hypothetical protein